MFTYFKIIYVFYIILIIDSNLLGQNKYFENADSNITEVGYEQPRDIFFLFSLGLIDPLTVGVGMQFDRFSVSSILKAAWVGNGYYVPNSGGGVGIRVGYHRKILFFNMLSFEFVPFLELEYYRPNKPIKSFPKGYYLAVNIGKEEVSVSGFNFFWAVGFAISSAKYESLLYGPTIKVGYNFNIISQREKQ